MPLSEEDKNYIVEKAVQILKAPDRKEQIAVLRSKVMSEDAERSIDLDDAIYSVLQAMEELYGE
jgi:hypothetical protein